MIEKLDSAILSEDYVIFGDLESDFVTFFSNDCGPNNVILDNINLMMNILITVIHKLLIMLGLWVGIININNVKHLKKIDKELLPVA